MLSGQASIGLTCVVAMTIYMSAADVRVHNGGDTVPVLSGPESVQCYLCRENVQQTLLNSACMCRNTTVK